MKYNVEKSLDDIIMDEENDFFKGKGKKKRKGFGEKKKGEGKFKSITNQLTPCAKRP